MALFHITAAKGPNPKTDREMTLKGGEAKHRGKWGTKGGKSEGQVNSFFARHKGNNSPVAFINALNWRKGSQIGRSVQIPDNRF